MNANNLISLLAVAISFVVFASNSRGADASADDRALIKIEDEWGVAYAECMTTADFTFVGPDREWWQRNSAAPALTWIRV
jgi:hypothetical protein